MKIKYPGKKGKRSIRVCNQCNCKFETLDIKVRKRGEKFCSIECYQKYRKDNKQDSKILNILYQKKFRYGLSKEEYYRLYESQNNKCAICNIEEKEINKLCVDHDHKTNIVRGLLCNNCNKLLGNAKDNTTILEKAIVYLGNSSNGKDAILIHSSQ